VARLSRTSNKKKETSMHRPLRTRLLGIALLSTLPLPALAQDLTWSGFGTIGYAQSNRAYGFDRFVDRSGTVDRDTVFGLQADGRLNAQWSATLQVKAAPSLKSDSSWTVRPAWAFVAWRPSDDWLVRVGRLRAPLYLYSESIDVGITHDMARLPTEMYSLAPSSDFDGLYVTKTWPTASGELTFDAYRGRIDTSARIWSRDGVPGQVAPGARFVDVRVDSSGAVLTWRQRGAQWRASAHHTSTRPMGSKVPVSFPFVPIAPGVGYYQVDEAQPGPGVPTVDRIRNDVITAGVEQPLGDGWRVVAEFARDFQHDTELGSDTRGGYVAVFKEIGRATPYVSVGMLRSSGSGLDWADRLRSNVLPPVVPGAAQINAAQRFAADNIYTADQRSLALGSSWSFGTQHKLKAEWKRTRIGRMSRLVDTPAGAADAHDTSIDIWSVGYSFAF
jgi:hypothetical protein